MALCKEEGEVNVRSSQLKGGPTSIAQTKKSVELIAASSGDWQTGKHVENFGKVPCLLDRAAASQVATPTCLKETATVFRPTPGIVTTLTRMDKNTDRTHDAAKTPISRAQKAHTRQTSKAPTYYIPQAVVWRSGVTINDTRPLVLLIVYGGKSWV